MDRRRDQGLALILVMTVILALAIIATPFVLSMILQERTGTMSRYHSQADYGADGAKNYALWRLMSGLDPIERRYGVGIQATYYYDIPQEFDIRVNDELGSKLKISDAKGAIWGVTAQDEQGKLNVKTCNPNAIMDLASMVDGRVINLKDYLTLYSGRDATWICPQRIRPVGYQTGTGGGGVTVDNLHVLGPQSRVRVTKPGMAPLETRITGNSILGSGGQGGFSTELSVQGYVDGVIEVEMRHPVNVNTAKREVLTAMFEGLSLFGLPGSQVSRGAASNLANRLMGRNIQRLEQFLMILASTMSGPQGLAVALNAVCPSAALLQGTGTVPVCFKSYDVYTLEAFASMNNPAGTEVAGRGYREVVSVSPPTTLQLSCESQYDFNQMMSQIAIALQALQPPPANNTVVQNQPLQIPSFGYPYSNRMLSYPQPITTLADVLLKPQQRPGPNGNEAYVTVLPSQDNRGELSDPSFEQVLTGWQDKHNRNHYSTELDGHKESGESFPWTQFFALNHANEDDALEPGQQRPDTGSGGFEVWAKWTSPPASGPIFDIQEQPTTNRVTLHLDNGELVLTAADATIPNTADPFGKIANGVAEIHWPNFTISPDTWTHFSAHWKSVRYADLALFVDGLSDPNAKFMHYTQPGGQELMTTLASALTPTSTSLTLKNSSMCPTDNEATPLLVGNEVILYNPSGGTAVRGARGTLAVDHQSQVNVSLYGYSSKIRNGTVIANYPNIPFSVTMTYNRIPQTSATSSYNFGAAPAAQVAGDKQDPLTMQWEINNIENTIGVTTAAIMDFPDQGYIRIDNEIIYYTGRAAGTVAGSMPPATAKFTGCQRAQFGTVAVNHRSGSNVQMWSVAANNLNNFPSPTIIQIGDEWFGPVQRDPSGKNFWVGFMNGQNPVNFRRGNACFAKVPSYHSAGDKVLPTFLGQDVDSWPSNGHAMGPGDRVTLTDAANQKMVARIRQTSPDPQPPGQPPIWPGEFSIQGATQVAALYDFASRDWVADDLFVRVLKFPSGELLSRAWLNTASPQVNLSVQGQIDELKAFAASKGRVRMAAPVGTTDTTLAVNVVAIPFFQNGGLFKVGDELIGYGNWTQGAAQGTVTQVKRGWLNSNGVIHDMGDSVFYLPWMPVGALTGDVGAEDKVLHLKARLQGDPALYTKGYVLVDNEMMLFEWNGGDGLTLSMPPQWDGQTGLYRGMFGTAPASHAAASSLVYGMPFRTWDTYKQRQFDDTMVYYQWSTKLDLANWNSFTWVQEIPASDKNIVVHAFARIDGRGEFWDPPGMTDRVLLIESLMGGANVPVNRTSYLQNAGQFDVRFYVEYKQGSFNPQNPRTAESWKRCPKIKQINVTYDRPSQTLHHEDR